MTLHQRCCAPCTGAALPAQALARPSCRSSPPEYCRQSSLGAGKTEGKIEGDGTARPCPPDLHKGGRGTRRPVRRAASRPKSAAMAATPRAVRAVLPPAATELPA